MNRFIQVPECGFTVEYTVTLIEKPYGSNTKQAFKAELERTQPDPKIVEIDFDNWMVIVNPKDESHEGRDFAVFINGNLAVNSTI